MTADGGDRESARNRAAEAAAAARRAISALEVATAATRATTGDVPRWGDERFQQQLRDGEGGDAARRLQAEVDAGRTTWEELRQDVPRYLDLQRQWASEVGAAMRPPDPEVDEAAAPRGGPATHGAHWSRDHDGYRSGSR